MPLSQPTDREELHHRRMDFKGYRRSDGLWDIEGHLFDAKTYAFHNDYRGEIQAGEPLHNMRIRLTIDDRFLIHDAEAVTDNGPFEVCPAITPSFKKMIGVTIAGGWRREIRARLGGIEGCTHLVELLTAMATVAFQTLYPILAKRDKGKAPTSKPRLIDSCHAFRSDGDVVKSSWPDYYTGK
jgi:hypothetical protein